MPAWQLALLLHPVMRERVGLPQIAQPGKRMEAIAAVERYLTATGAKAQPDPEAPKPKPRTLLQKLTRKVKDKLPQAPVDTVAWDLKRLLYSELTEVDYHAACVDGKPPVNFDHAYARELGLAQLEQEATWKRGEEFVRMAVNGLPAEGVRLCVKLAQAHEKAGNIDAVYEYYERAKAAGRAAGPKNLKAEDRTLYYGVLKALAEDAVNRGDLDTALENYHLYTEYERAGVETYRCLAKIYEQKKDAWAALRCCEQGLQYDKTDKDMLTRKDSYYYSVTVEQMKERWENIKGWFDIPYCLQKARWLLDRQGDADLLDWSGHLLDLAQTIVPQSLVGKVLRARLLRRRGEVEKAVAMLEEVRANKPGGFASNDEAEAWYGACRQLGELYLSDNPQRAVECLLDFLKSTKSGADTYYKLGVAHENLGDYVRAAKWYEQVTAYDNHPLAPDARDRLYRLRHGAQQQQM
jgi:tetratricopeptide (TPR) repeat protein